VLAVTVRNMKSLTEEDTLQTKKMERVTLVVKGL